MERNFDKETIRRILLDINPLVRKYYRNIVKFHTGINPTEAGQLDLEESIHFIKHIWGSCLDWGNQSLDYIEKSIHQLSNFLSSFTSKEEIHNPRFFLERLEKHPSEKNIYSINEDQIFRLTELLQKFHSVRIKTAALIMRFLCLDSNFFELDKSRLIPPLDRVNYRMCLQLFDKQYILDKLGPNSVSFDKRATYEFNDIGKQVLGENKILIDNLWFLGHFYHDRRKKIAQTCGIREGVLIVDYPFLKDIIEGLPKRCPFAEYGCKRSV